MSGFRPPQWDDKSLIYARTSVGGYFFDAIIKAEHSSSLRITEHPIQNGANISDHAIVLPCKLTLEIAMSDVMDSIVAGQFEGAATKSINAFQKLKELQTKKTLLEITTRLNNYKNMLIESISAGDDVKTFHGLRCVVTFKEIFVADVTQTLVSSRRQATSKPTTTAVQPTMPNSTIAAQIEEYAFGKDANKPPTPLMKAH